MGITGLYKWLDSIKRQEHVKKYEGLTLGVDTYSWLHKGAFSCTLELVQGTPTSRYVDYCMERIKMLQHYGVTPYLVFDGDYLPSKADTETDREKRREESRQEGLKLLKTDKRKAMDILQKAVDVTPLMARAVIEACKAAGVGYVVAPYEADAQLYYLEKTGVINGVISEDSDLLVFGVRLLVTKMDSSGGCVEFNRDDFARNKAISLAGWTDAEFRMMAILSGCDYLPSIKGIGLKKAHGYVRSHKTVDRIVRAIKLDGKMSVPNNYLEGFKQAELTFLHQRVWCPTTEMMVMCTKPETPLTGEALVFIGAEVELRLAHGVARGDLDPMTKLPFNLENIPTYTPKQLTTQSCATKKPQLYSSTKGTVPKVNITSFFATPTSTPVPPPRTPLGVRSTNVQVIRKAFTVPRPSSCLTPTVKKRNPEEEPKTDLPLKKSRVFGPDENVRATGERSAFFNTPKHLQSRRPLGELGIARTVVSNAAALETPISKKLVKAALPVPGTKDVLEKGLSDFEKAIQASLKPEYLPDNIVKGKGEREGEGEGEAGGEVEEEEETGVQRVARSLKVDFGFKNTPNGKLAKFVEKQRVGATKAKVRKSGFMQQFRRGPGMGLEKMQIPHTVGVGEESQDSAIGGDIVGLGDSLVGFGDGESQGSEGESQGFGKGLEAFMLKQ